MDWWCGGRSGQEGGGGRQADRAAGGVLRELDGATQTRLTVRRLGGALGTVRRGPVQLGPSGPVRGIGPRGFGWHRRSLPHLERSE
jgi:hypothetical protein